MNRIQQTDFWILSSFAERVRAIPGIQERTIPAAQALLAEAEQSIGELIRNGHSRAESISLLNEVVKMVQGKISEHKRRRWEREDRAERLREVRAEAYHNQ